MQLKLEFIFSHIYIAHKIIRKNVENHWIVWPPCYLIFRSQKATDGVALIFFTHKTGLGGRERSELVTMQCSSVPNSALAHARGASELLAVRQRNESICPVGKKSSVSDWFMRVLRL